MKKNKDNFRLYADSAPFVTLIYDDSKKWIYANKEAQAFTGFTEEKLLTQSFWELVAPKYQQLIKERGLSRLKGEWPQDK
ncbi:MAG: PAS domain-containing protein, partial [Thermotogota bacterium]|nr:PAS domain-containing protein [Thermotogota bacterium]